MTIREFNIPFDESHTWGRYLALDFNPHTILRIIEFHVGGRTSVHLHQNVTETLVVIAGAIRCYSGRDPQALTSKVFSQGQVFRVAADCWHATECEIPIDELHPYALAAEVVQGTMDNFNYPIERAWPAIPAIDRIKD